MLSDSSVCPGREAKDTQYGIAKVKGVRGISGYRMSDTHNKRNNSIGLGAFDYLDLVVTESVIRWASMHTYLSLMPLCMATFRSGVLSMFLHPLSSSLILKIFFQIPFFK